MDLIKTLLVYMMMVVSASTEAAPAITPPVPGLAPTPTPYVTVVPTLIPTLAPTATPTPTQYTTLYVNDRGDAVRKLQRRLTELGYLNDKIDGIYGQNTKKAVERFQYYNDLKVDGIAGRATQTLLYESTAVVTAPPEITKAPTPTTPTSVTVPVYYVDQNGKLLKRVNMVCYGTTTIYANSGNVGTGYTLISSGAVTVTVRNGVASPSSVTFQYRENPTTVTIPVYYRTEAGRLLYQTSQTLAVGTTSYVTVNTSLVSSSYQLTSAGTVAVQVTSAGTASPTSVVFIFRDNSPTTPPDVQIKAVTVRYVEEEKGTLLHETTENIRYGTTENIYAYTNRVPEGYQLVSQSPVSVRVDASGYATPTVVTFVFRAPTPTAAPVYQDVTIYYVDEEGMPLAQEIRSVQRGTSTVLSPNNALVPSGYTLSSAPTQEVTVDLQGNQAPEQIIFRYAAPPAPTDAPATTLITVRLLEKGTEKELHSYQTAVQLGKTTTLFAEFSALPPEYTPAGETMLDVYVDENGIPTPQPVFYFEILSVPTETPTEEPTEMPTETPTEEPTEMPTEKPTEEPTETPTEEPTEMPTEKPTEEPTEMPTEKPTEEPTEMPTEEPTEMPTEMPTEKPTEMPTEKPTEEPPTGLTDGGSSIQLNGSTIPLSWFKDESGNAMISLQMLASSAGWGYTSGAPCTVNGHEFVASYNMDGVSTLTVDGQSQRSNGRVWNNDLYVNLAFLRALGADASVSGGSLIISFPQE